MQMGGVLNKKEEKAEESFRVNSFTLSSPRLPTGVIADGWRTGGGRVEGPSMWECSPGHAASQDENNTPTFTVNKVCTGECNYHLVECVSRVWRR